MNQTPAVPAFRALILEDHDFQRHVGAQVLKQCGAGEVLEAMDGARALDIVETEDDSIDVLLCDLNMPGMDGLEFLRHIAERRNRSSVILASALDASIIRAAEIMAKSYGLRIIGVVEKPISRVKLMPLLLRHFSQNLSGPRPTVELLPLADIVRGIAQDQFEPFFQPKVDMRTGALASVEALIRWRHPELGLVSPGAFVPVMESNGLISAISYTIIEKALAHGRRWQDNGLDVPIAVNVSVESLSDTNLPDRLEALTLAAQLPTSFMTIEITETVAMTDLGHALETLARCRMKGFGLSIDDYGTGFSSMQQLTRLPLTELKIDQAFVTGAAKAAVLEALIETSVTMAKRLNLKTIAEGVETSEDWDVVARLGCDAAQGYFIARPMPGDDLIRWHTAWLGDHKA